MRRQTNSPKALSNGDTNKQEQEDDECGFDVYFNKLTRYQKPGHWPLPRDCPRTLRTSSMHEVSRGFLYYILCNYPSLFKHGFAWSVTIGICNGFLPQLYGTKSINTLISTPKAVLIIL